MLYSISLVFGKLPEYGVSTIQIMGVHTAQCTMFHFFYNIRPRFQKTHSHLVFLTVLPIFQNQ